MTTWQARSGDEPILLSLRVRALTADPAAFTSTSQRERSRTIEDWRRWLSPGATFFWSDAGLASATAPAPGSEVGDSHPGGLCAVSLYEPGCAHLAAMWVDPRFRGRGAGDELVGVCSEWARSRDLRIDLLVFRMNEAAVRLYRRHGFVSATQQVEDPAMLRMVRDTRS